MSYIIDEAFKRRNPSAVTVIQTPDGKWKRVSLFGEIKVQKPGGAGGPPSEVVIPQISDEELQFLQAQGAPYVVAAPPRKTEKKD